MKKFNLISFLFKSPNPVTYEICFVFINGSAYAWSVYMGMKWYSAALVFLAGMVSWVLVEYLIHRFVFHHKSNSPTIRKIVYSIHGVHHAHSHDHDKMYVPLIPAIIITLLQLSLYCSMFGLAGFPLLGGVMTMHQFYNLIHLAIHNNSSPKNPIIQKLRNNHIKHHKGFGEKCFGVTSTVFDRIFNTL
jgi:4-hydroxysphinganine ceramide fatty acyl 2-hydroxylase